MPHFLKVYWFQTKIFVGHFHFLLNIWVRVDCTPKSQQIYSSNSTRKKTGCDEYVEDQLNVAGAKACQDGLWTLFKKKFNKVSV